MKKQADEAERKRQADEATRLRLAQVEELKKQSDNETRRLQMELEKLRLENERLQADSQENKNKMIGKLNVSVKEAKNLQNKCDAYGILKLESQEYKTKTAKKSNSPTWDQDYEFFFVTNKRSELEVVLWDWDRFTKDKTIGKAVLKISDLMDGQKESRWIKLQPVQEERDFVSGEILIQFQFVLG